VRLGVDTQQRGIVGEGRRFALDERIDAAADQLIFDCLQARWTLGMPLPHLVQQTVGVGIEACCHIRVVLPRDAASVRGMSPSVWAHAG